jgi:peroxiredoxin Q/BCP
LQACGLRDSFDRVTATGIDVFGVSPDSVKSHAKFRDKYALPYRLLADDGHRLAEAYGVWIEKNAMGRTYFGNERTTFIIGPDGGIERVLPRVKPDEHVDQLLAALAVAA